jgi:hypothetical protein
MHANTFTTWASNPTKKPDSWGVRRAERLIRILTRKPAPKPDPLKAAQAEYLAAWKRQKAAIENRDARDLQVASLRLRDATTALLQAESGL